MKHDRNLIIFLLNGRLQPTYELLKRNAPNDLLKT